MKKFILVILFTLFYSNISISKEKIELIMPYAAGGSSDLLARRISNLLSDNNNKFSVEVINKVGANGKLAYHYFIGQKRTMLVDVINVISQQNTEDYPKDLLSHIKALYFSADPPRLLYTSLPVKDIHQLRTLSETTEILFGAGNPGSSSHDVYDWLCNKANVLKKCNVVFYRGTGHAMPDVLSGRIHVYTASYNTVVHSGFTSGGKAKEVLALSNITLESLPELPTLTSLKDVKNTYDMVDWHGLFHHDLQDTEVQEIKNRLSKLPEEEWFKKEGYSRLDQITPENFLKSQIQKFKK